ncbi:hypothetical protein [Dactylosporangium sp. CA-233914]|uniref:hypothetical protein n=1 Tax=Dactylosporangium sp. CA-233914 TaxID=3239934 RepID=UPI003D8D554A
MMTLTGCTTKSDEPDSPAATTAAPAPASTDPVAIFKAAVAKTNQNTMTFTIDTDLGTLGSQKGSGAADPRKKSTGYHGELLTADRKVEIDAILVGQDLYLKVTGLTTDRWAHVDMTKIKSLARLGLDPTGNPTGLGSLSDEIVSVRQTAPGSFSGTLDRTKSPLLSGTDAADALKSVPFEAKVNSQGYVTSLVTHTPPVGTAPAATSTTQLAAFAQPITIDRPDSAEVEQATDAVYQALQ